MTAMTQPVDVPENRRTAQKLEADVIAWMQQQKDGFAENWLKEAESL